MKHVQILTALTLTVSFSLAYGQAIYKTVDEEGNISYSSVKPEGNSKAQIVEPPREPTPEEVEAARQRQQDLQDSVEELRERRKQKEEEQALADYNNRSYRSKRVEQQVLPVPVLREPRVPRPRPLPTVRPTPPAAVPF